MVGRSSISNKLKCGRTIYSYLFLLTIVSLFIN